MGEAKTKAPRIANYLISNYSDLRDVVFTIENMILETKGVRDKSVLRNGCKLSIIPLEDRDGFILRFRLHEAITP